MESLLLNFSFADPVIPSYENFLTGRRKVLLVDNNPRARKELGELFRARKASIMNEKL